MVGESDKNVLLIQIEASSFAEFEISEFEISRVNCKYICIYGGGMNFFTSKKIMFNENSVDLDPLHCLHRTDETSSKVLWHWYQYSYPYIPHNKLCYLIWNGISLFWHLSNYFQHLSDSFFNSFCVGSRLCRVFILCGRSAIPSSLQSIVNLFTVTWSNICTVMLSA